MAAANTSGFKMLRGRKEGREGGGREDGGGGLREGGVLLMKPKTAHLKS